MLCKRAVFWRFFNIQWNTETVTGSSGRDVNSRIKNLISVLEVTLPGHMGSRDSSLIARSPPGRADGFPSCPAASPLDHTGNHPPRQSGRPLCLTYTCKTIKSAQWVQWHFVKRVIQQLCRKIVLLLYVFHIFSSYWLYILLFYGVLFLFFPSLSKMIDQTCSS